MRAIPRTEFHAWVQAQGGYGSASFWVYLFFDQGRQLKTLLIRAVEAMEYSAGLPCRRAYSKP